MREIVGRDQDRDFHYEYTDLSVGSDFKGTVVEVAGDRGPCGGVNMAIDTTFDVLKIVDGREPVYANNEPVHNRLIAEEFQEKGLVIQPDLNLITDGSILIASAHGWPPQDRELAQSKDLLVIDTTCQLVTKVARAAERAVAEGKHVVYVGAKNHPEPRGILGRLPDGAFTFVDINGDEQLLPHHSSGKFATLNQTTLSTKGITERIEELRETNPSVEIPDPAGICYATDNRQNAVRQRIFDTTRPPIDALLVVGSEKSHNSNELRNVGLKEASIPSFLVDTPEEIDESWFDNAKSVLVTSGASVLDPYLQRVLEYFKKRGAVLEFLPRTERDLTFVGPDLNPLRQRFQS